MILSKRDGRFLVDGIPVEDLEPEQRGQLQAMLARLLEPIIPTAQSLESFGALADLFAGVDEFLGSGRGRQDPPAVARGLTVRGIRQAAAEARQQLDGQPTRALTAELLRTSPATLDRAMNELDMEPWPPGPPDD